MQIDIGASSVDQIYAEHALTLVLSGGVQIRIETPFDLSEVAAVQTTIDPEDLSADHEFRGALRGRIVEAAIADEDTGSLTLTFRGGLVLQVPSDAAFEAWSASWSDGSLVVALPGGGLRSWGAQQ